MATRMDRQEIIDMTIDIKLAIDRNLIPGETEYVKCGACPDVYPKPYQTFTAQYCVPCHLEKEFGIVAEEVLEHVETIAPTVLPASLHEVKRQPRGHGLY